MDVLAYYTLAGVNVTSRLKDAGNYMVIFRPAIAIIIFNISINQMLLSTNLPFRHNIASNFV